MYYWCVYLPYVCLPRAFIYHLHLLLDLFVSEKRARKISAVSTRSKTVCGTVGIWTHAHTIPTTILIIIGYASNSPLWTLVNFERAFAAKNEPTLNYNYKLYYYISAWIFMKSHFPTDCMTETHNNKKITLYNFLFIFWFSQSTQ